MLTAWCLDRRRAGDRSSGRGGGELPVPEQKAGLRQRWDADAGAAKLSGQLAALVTSAWHPEDTPWQSSLTRPIGNGARSDNDY